MGARGGAAAAALGEALADADTAVRVGAAMALDNMGAAAAPAVRRAASRPCAIRSAEVRPWAAQGALGSVGSAAESAVPALERAARLDGVHGPAEEAIRKIRAR